MILEKRPINEDGVKIIWTNKTGSDQIVDVVIHAERNDSNSVKAVASGGTVDFPHGKTNAASIACSNNVGLTVTSNAGNSWISIVSIRNVPTPGP